MEVYKNESGQPIILTVGKGKVIHLLAGKSVALTAGEQRFHQVQALKSRGILRMVKIKGVAKESEIKPAKEKVDEEDGKKPGAVKPAEESKKEDDKKAVKEASAIEPEEAGKKKVKEKK